MSKELELEIFRAGDYGEKGRYTAEDLEQIAKDYSAELHEAPVTIDHAPSGPAFGWVKGLKRVGDKLVARLKGLVPGFFELLKQGAYKKPSIELYRKLTATGRPYLRALSLLGAQPPEVKGLTEPVFNDQSEFITLELENEAEQDTPVSVGPSQPSGAKDDDTQIDFSEVEKLREENEHLHQELEVIQRQGRLAGFKQFCDELKSQGRFLPAWEKLGVVEFMEQLDAADVHCFGEHREATQLEWFKKFLSSLPQLIPLGEVASAEPAVKMAEDLKIAPPVAAALSQRSIELHRRALSYMEGHPDVSYVEALKAVVQV